MARPRTTIADRLKEAIKHWGPPGRGSIRKLQRAMEARAAAQGLKIPGTSYASVHAYTRNEGPEPSVEFLRTAAEVLGVRPEWLLLDLGERTTTEQQFEAIAEELADHTKRAQESREAFLSELMAILEETIPRYDELWRAHVAVNRAFELHALSRHEEAHPEGGLLEEGIGLVVARQVAEAVAAPVTILGRSLEELPKWQAEAYVINVTSAISLLLPPTRVPDYGDPEDADDA